MGRHHAIIEGTTRASQVPFGLARGCSVDPVRNDRPPTPGLEPWLGPSIPPSFFRSTEPRRRASRPSVTACLRGAKRSEHEPFSGRLDPSGGPGATRGGPTFPVRLSSRHPSATRAMPYPRPPARPSVPFPATRRRPGRVAGPGRLVPHSRFLHSPPFAVEKVALRTPVTGKTLAPTTARQQTRVPGQTGNGNCARPAEALMAPPRGLLSIPPPRAAAFRVPTAPPAAVRNTGDPSRTSWPRAAVHLAGHAPNSGTGRLMI